VNYNFIWKELSQSSIRFWNFLPSVMQSSKTILKKLKSTTIISLRKLKNSIIKVVGKKRNTQKYKHRSAIPVSLFQNRSNRSEKGILVITGKAKSRRAV